MDFKPNKYIEPDFTEERFSRAPDCVLCAAPGDGIAPEGFHATSIFPEYFKRGGVWHLAEDMRMDALAVWDGENVRVVEFRNIKKGDLVVTGRTEDASEGIYVHSRCFESDGEESDDVFSFRRGRSRETGFSADYERLVKLLRYERENGGYVVWVLGPACSFDVTAREIMSRIISAGYCQALLAGNALATHDLEGAYLGTALGCDLRTQKSREMGHYNHLDTINAVRACGSAESFIKEKNIESGIIRSCVKSGVPFVLTGSIRDDGPLPEVTADTYEGQDKMRFHISRATTVIGMASVLHTIAAGNMTPSYRVTEDGTIRPIYFYMVDSSDFAAGKLSDRGSLTAKSIVTNVQDFMKTIGAGLGLYQY